MQTVDLNCDMGEGMNSDHLVMPFITSANIACGYHAGDAETMATTIRLAVQHNVAIGAHPGFNDKPNFGRIPLQLPDSEVYTLVREQIQTLQLYCKQAGAALHHVKPHGALYNMAALNKSLAAAIASAVYDVNPNLILYGLSGSYLISQAAAKGLQTASEVFADRTYQPDGSLTPRNQPNALIHDKARAIAQVLQMVQQQKVISTDGTTIPITAQTICLHGDGEHAVDFATAIHQQLIHNHIELKAC